VPDHLIDHRYTVLEIDEMRSAIFEIMNPVRWMSATSAMVLSSPDPDEVERMLRTYMLNGTRPDELNRMAIEAREKSENRRKAFEKGA
jgi:hypothetical protein